MLKTIAKLGTVLAMTWAAYLAGVENGVAIGTEGAEFQRLLALQKGYTEGLRDGARCMAHLNCFTISPELSQFAKTLRVKH